MKGHAMSNAIVNTELSNAYNVALVKLAQNIKSLLGAFYEADHPAGSGSDAVDRQAGIIGNAATALESIGSERINPIYPQSRDDHFGVCPQCGKTGEMLNVADYHWLVCHEHKLRWLIGSNLFSSWQHENEDDWQRNFEIMQGYKEIGETHVRVLAVAEYRASNGDSIREAYGETKIREMLGNESASVDLHRAEDREMIRQRLTSHLRNLTGELALLYIVDAFWPADEDGTRLNLGIALV